VKYGSCRVSPSRTVRTWKRILRDWVPDPSGKVVGGSQWNKLGLTHGPSSIRHQRRFACPSSDIAPCSILHPSIFPMSLFILRTNHHEAVVP
jgi:hypothetical protein